MGWKYRVVKENNLHQIYEVYYNDDGSIRMMSLKPITPVGINADRLKKDLKHMIVATEEPVLKKDEIEFNNPKKKDNES